MINYNNFLTEKLGINDDVIKLVDFLIPLINNNEISITKNIPITTFKIYKIVIKYTSNELITGGFFESRSKLTKDGYILYLILNKEKDIKSSLYHELTHVIKFQNLTNKNIKMLNNDFGYPDKRFDELLFLLYCVDDSEINAKVAEIYSNIEDEIKTINIDKKEIFKDYINSLIFKENNPYLLINYNIHEDLINVSDKDKIKFFQYISSIKNIRKNGNKLFNIIKYLFGKKDYNLNLDSIMIKTQKHINNQGKKLLSKIEKLYDLF
ncbi:hypothetical protein M0Q97_12610 [Candidatus Dojkabacteria bacterium]|jgi:hypothetical protein|nr:hypothetical protein [Candidatus Dojkabacteria bacterium]